MGRMNALGMKESVDNGWIDLDNALLWHLRSNHYPPIPSSMVATCKRAIQYANRGKWNSEIKLPDGILYKGNKKTAPVWDIIESHHLDSFLDCEEDYGD